MVRKGKHGYWLPTPRMVEAGFRPVPCGHDGPDAWKIAQEWEQRWQEHRRGIVVSTGRVWPKDSVGDAFGRFRRTESWKAKKPRTREDWERGWRFIEPYFGDQPPAKITFEHLDKWYHRLLVKKGVDTAYRGMKTWRALYEVMAGMHLAARGQDPSKAIRRKTPTARHQIWSEGEVVRLVKGAWRGGYHGLACIIAVAWDTSFAPVDVRTLTPAQTVEAGTEWGFLIQRTKTGEPAFGTLSARSRRMVLAYVDQLGALVLPDSPLFRSRGYTPASKGGGHVLAYPTLRMPLSMISQTFAGSFLARTKSAALWTCGDQARSRQMLEADRSRRCRPRWATRLTRTRRCKRPTCPSISQRSEQLTTRACVGGVCFPRNATGTKS